MATCKKCRQPVPLWQKDIFTGLCPKCRAGVTPVNLGCGTLILIAVIVAVVSQAGFQDLEDEVRSLRATVQELKEAVDSQTSEIRQLRTKIEKLQGPADKGAAKTEM